VSGNPWTGQELEILMRDYPFKTAAELSTLIHRPPRSIITKASDMGIKKNPDFWRKNKCLPKIGWQDRYDSPERKIRPIGKNEMIPKIPCCLLWQLRDMEGCMDTKP
jgi:hypothetical protein